MVTQAASQLGGAVAAIVPFGLLTVEALTLFLTLVFTAIAGLLAWRLALGALSMQTAGQTTMVLRVPVWWAYLPAVAALVLLTVVCAYTAWSGLRAALGRRGRLPAAERTLAEGPY